MRPSRSNSRGSLRSTMHHVLAAMKGDGLGRRQGLDAGRRILEHRLVAPRNRLWHLPILRFKRFNKLVMIALMSTEGADAGFHVRRSRGGRSSSSLAWFGYHAAVELTHAGKTSLNRLMNEYRYRWMEQMVDRENRIVDTTILSALMNGTAFFASTSLLAIGGVLALLRSSDAVLPIFAGLPFGEGTTALMWELKSIGLAVMFVYAFFKFAWSYRLFNYMAIVVGAVPVLRAGQPR